MASGMNCGVVATSMVENDTDRPTDRPAAALQFMTMSFFVIIIFIRMRTTNRQTNAESTAKMARNIWFSLSHNYMRYENRATQYM